MKKNPNRTRSWRGSALLIVAIVVVGLYLGYRFYESKHNAVAMREETLHLAIPAVTILSAKEAAANETITLPGNFVAWHQAPIYARIDGYVESWYADYGAKVKKGDLLAILNTPMIDAEYRMAEAEVAAKQAEYNLAVVTKNRYVGLGGTKAVSVQSVSVQKANERVKKAELKRAEQELQNVQARRHFKHILAPFDGVVIERNINVGDYVNEQGSLSLKGKEDANIFTVADTRKMRLFVSVPESFGPFLQPGLEADVTVPQFPGRHFTAKFLTVAGGFDVSTRTAVTEFLIDNEDGVLWPGSFASVNITAPLNSGALIIPVTSMIFEEDGATVAVVTEDNRIHFKPIKVTKILPTTLEVAGISKTDRIVDNPSAFLLEGDEVHIVTKPAKGYIKSPPGFGGKAEDTEGTEAADKEAPDSGAQSLETEAASQSLEAEAASQRSADNDAYEVGPYRLKVALEPKKPVVGKNIVVIYLQNKQGQPVEGANIKAIAKMPAIGSTPSQQVPAAIREVKPGVYGGLLELPAEGSWPLTLRFKAAGTDTPYQVVLDMATGRRLTVKDNLQSKLSLPNNGQAQSKATDET
jgi:RND family efflux transporter MFP subunit